jgi:hypothetical protein
MSSLSTVFRAITDLVHPGGTPQRVARYGDILDAPARQKRFPLFRRESGGGGKKEQNTSDEGTCFFHMGILVFPAGGESRSTRRRRLVLPYEQQFTRLLEIFRFEPIQVYSRSEIRAIKNDDMIS